jgi:hypothetical protein
MKEATGELNMTVVTVVAIAAVAAFFYAFVWPAIKNNIARNTHCANAICDSTCSKGVCNCVYIDGNGSSQSVKCNAQNDSVVN